MIVGLYCFFISPYYWVSFDEGQLGHSAERILNGERPFIDFDEPYTGGLAYIHAFIFSLFGERLIYLRYSLVLCILITVWPVFCILKNYYSSFQTLILTTLVFLLTFPSYFSALPSWYMSLITLWVIYLNFIYIKTSNLLSIAFTGFLIALATLLKINGIFILFASIFFIFNLKVSQLNSINSDTPNRSNILPVIFISIAIIALISFLYSLSAKIAIAMNLTSVLLFLLPSYFLSYYTISNLISKKRLINLITILQIISPILVLLITFTFVILIYFLLIYDLSELQIFFQGVFVAPQERIKLYNSLPPSILLYIFLAVIFLIIKRLQHHNLLTIPTKIINISLFLILLLLLFNDLTYLFYVSITFWCLVLILNSLIFSDDTEEISLMIGVNYCLFSLLQFPYFDIIYMIYPLPLLLVYFFIKKISFCTSLFKHKYLCVFLIFFLLFKTTAILTGGKNGILSSVNPFKIEDVQELTLKNSGLWLHRHQISEMELLNETLNEDFAHKKILATPDATDVYYFSKIKNRTKIFYDDLSFPTIEDQINYFKSFKFDVIVINTRSYRYFKYNADILLIHPYVKSNFKFHKTIGRFQIYVARH